ncbi:hypothetical protein AGABI2DRAFT_114899 [Agaricus bisporus var. bisporus H97]|uniref:hypothetical protein n=1 Tax=Agaricus bisporus var. bisporus (strain H97 / ATCC MYA-4626 / FGSC 10389) TaxID=936046 RepID=UPI00029F6232|nr:hypothetical protein AGABI2DRAFT_114899 [Agaricus bisporus var. bisporus H97]EKV49829.1 hypothetical protein AGABI2DRAFT_114899 [Agaricus bisporus var. bisporus H97]
MCFPTNSTPGTDMYMGHGLMARAFSKYISLTPTLRGCYSRGTSPSEEPLDFYVARVIHLCQIPDIIPYIALYILIYSTQTCHCRRPREDNDDACSYPSKLSHVLSRAVTRTQFSRIRKSHWSAAHVFMGAFMVALQTSKVTFDGETDDFCRWSILPEVSGIPEEELEEICEAFKQCLTCELRVAINKMRFERVFKPFNEVDCPFQLARRNQLLKIRERKENGQRRRLSLKGSIGHLLKPKEKETDSIESEE